MGGYTDSDVDVVINKDLSLDRAETAKKELQVRGISGNRIDAEELNSDLN